MGDESHEQDEAPTESSHGWLVVEAAHRISQLNVDVLKLEFPERASQINFTTPDEKSKRHGQAVAAASLPATHYT